jgi:succinate-acetate transporter protein
MTSTTGTVQEVRGTPIDTTVARAERRREAARMVIANPVALGLSGFGLTTVVLSAINAHWLDGSTLVGVLALAIVFGGGAQFIAGLWAFARGETFVATAFCGYGAFWLSFWVLEAFFAPMIRAQAGTGQVNAFTALYLFMWGVFTTYLFIASLAQARGPQIVLGLLVPTYFALAIGYWAGQAAGWIILGGWLGVLCGVAALYVAGAEVVNASFGRRVIPV